MSSDGKKVVWVLGAGFSKSLGGPLLPDLLSHRGRAYQHAKLPSIAGYQVYQAYWAHLKGAQESHSNPIYWDHAEEFLEFLSDAAGGSEPRAAIMREVLKGVGESGEPKLSTCLATALQCVAAECFFTSHANAKSEAWDPYRRWAKTLDRNHTIISFNYDLILELLGASDRSLKLGQESVVVPTLGNLDEITEAQTVPIIKLHGSVNWFSYPIGAIEIMPSEDALKHLAARFPPKIAIPGPGKLAQLETEMKQLWELAMNAMSQANVVVFLGYRFPPSDSSARQRMLKAIAGSPPHYVRLHTVLGPQVEHEHSVRLMRLLAHTLEGAGRTFPNRTHGADSPMKYQGAHHEAHVIQHALYVEDFLSVFHGQLLHGTSWDPGIKR